MVAIKKINSLTRTELATKQKAAYGALTLAKREEHLGNPEFIHDTQTELRLMDKRFELLNSHVDKSQLDKLEGFFVYSWAKEWDKEDDRDYKRDNHFWAEQLDEAGIPWAIQNDVAALAEVRENGFKNFQNLLCEKSGITIVDDLIGSTQYGKDVPEEIDANNIFEFYEFMNYSQKHNNRELIHSLIEGRFESVVNHFKEEKLLKEEEDGFCDHSPLGMKGLSVRSYTGTYFIGYSCLGVQDNFQPIEDYLESIEKSPQYSSLVAKVSSEAVESFLETEEKKLEVNLDIKGM